MAKQRRARDNDGESEGGGDQTIRALYRMGYTMM